MYPHRIRLRGPWTCEPLFRLTPDLQHSTENLPPAFRMIMPGRWSDGGLSDFRGAVRCQRPFGYPGRIDDNERVWLTLAGLDDRADVWLNDKLIGEIEGPAEFEITSMLQSRNLLLIDVESMTSSGGLWGEVAMEVRATAFLRDIRFEWVLDQVTASGLVVGEAQRPLDLYLFARSQFLSHTLVEPTRAGKAFSISAALPGAPRSAAIQTRVELVDAATIWYVVKGVLEPPQTNAGGVSS